MTKLSLALRLENALEKKGWKTDPTKKGKYTVMNFRMFQDLGLHLVNGQYLIQGRRVFLNAGHVPITYETETFLITSDRKRAHMKFALLVRCTCKL